MPRRAASSYRETLNVHPAHSGHRFQPSKRSTLLKHTRKTVRFSVDDVLGVVYPYRLSLGFPEHNPCARFPRKGADKHNGAVLMHPGPSSMCQGGTYPFNLGGEAELSVSSRLIPFVLTAA